MTSIQLPEGYRLETLRRAHPRKGFRCGVQAVGDWLALKALQHQEKHLSVTKVVFDQTDGIAGCYTLATGQVDFGDLPVELRRKLPRRLLPVAVLVWLGVSGKHQNQGLGQRLLAHALRDCYEAGQTFAFVAVILDCLGDAAKAFYQKWDFAELPGNPYRLFISTKHLDAMMQAR